MVHLVRFPGIVATPQSEVLLLIILLALSLLLMFAGRSIIKAIVFIAAGLVGALVGAVIGAIILGLIGLGIGVISGYFAYELLRILGLPFIVSLFFGFIFFIVGLLLTNRFLELATAIAGGFIFFSVASSLGLPFYISFIAAFVLAALGYFSQIRSKHPQPATRL